MATPGSQLGPTLVVEGTVSTTDDVLVQGRVVGEVVCEQTLTVSAEAVLDADLRVRGGVVEGVVVGQIAATEKLTVAASARIKGGIKARRLEVTPGARIAGKIETGVELPAVRAGISTRRRSAASASPPARSREATEEPEEPRESVEPEPDETGEAATETVETAPSEEATVEMETATSEEEAVVETDESD